MAKKRRASASSHDPDVASEPREMDVTQEPSTKRVTRSSARLKKSKEGHSANTDSHLVQKHESDAKIKKPPQKKPKPKTKTVTKPKPQPHSSPNSKPSKAPEHPKETDTPTPLPPNTTTLTIPSPLTNKPISCHHYTPATTTQSPTPTPLIFTHGAGGTLTAPAVLNFCAGFSAASSRPVLVFQRSMNLGARVKGFRGCWAHVVDGEQGGVECLLGGRSMGARAAVIAATQILAEAQQGERSGVSVGRVRLILVSYPLQGPKDIRDQILLDLPAEVEVLFVIGDRDAMCPIELLKGVREKMRARSWLCVVRGADHGMNVRPVGRTKERGEESGRVAARWVDGGLGEGDEEGEVVYVGEEG